MLLGFFSPVTDWLNEKLSDLIKFAIEKIIQPVLEFVIKLVTYFLSIYFYNISVMILSLIDYVEVLFKALAGIGTEATITFNDQAGNVVNAGDPLVQLIRTKVVQDAFVSMVIVGLFLLVVTSVFQIVKTEYTTEGAKNAKGPILQKAFKGLANLILLPALVVLGTIFANHLLQLLNTATGGGGKKTIAGVMFTAAASDAFYSYNILNASVESDVKVNELSGKQRVTLDSAIPVVAVIDLLFEFKDIISNASNKGTPIVGYAASTDKEKYVTLKNAISASFESREVNKELVCYGSDGFDHTKFTAANHSIYDIRHVTYFYDISSINYLLLIFGGCIVLKCLYYSCFGMVVRLYKCVYLFIISPAVIGMTPINEGGLGKWRGQFIGQVLSAYGTILSLNLFFQVVGLFLSVELTFAPSYNNPVSWIMDDIVMTGLLRGIFVIAGCLLIEKFSKELGGFFGAEDAMSAGKDMSKQVVDSAMSGVKVAAAVGMTVASGGASLAAKGAGLASKLGAAGKAGKEAGDAAYHEARMAGKSDKEARGIARQAKRQTRNESLFGSKTWKETKESKEARAEVKKQKENFATHDDRIKKAQKEKQELIYQMHALSEEDQQGKKGDDIREKIAEQQEIIENSTGFRASAQTNLKDAEGKVDRGIFHKTLVSDRVEDVKEGAKNVGKKVKEGASNAWMWARSYGEGAKADMIGRIPGMKQVKEMDKMAHDGAKMLGDPYVQAMAGIDKDKEKKRQDKAANEFPAQLLMARAAVVASDRMIEEMRLLRENAVKQGQKMLDDLNKALTNAKAAGASEFDQLQIKNSYVEQFKNMGAKIDVNGLDKLRVDPVKLDAGTLHLDFNPESIKKAVKEAMAKGQSMDAIREALVNEFKKMGAEGNANLIKQIEGIITKVMNDMGGGK